MGHLLRRSGSLPRHVHVSRSVLVLLLLSLPARGHHSFAAEFDASRPVTLQGIVIQLAWLNPHIHFSLNVKDSGLLTYWDLEAGSPNSMTRRGWTRDSLKPGDVVTVHALRARDGSRRASVERVILTDGRSIDVSGVPAGSRR